MKIYLIVAAASGDPLKNVNPFMPLSLPVLAAAAPQHQYKFTDMLSEPEAAVDYEGDYDVVGISYRVSASDQAFAIADKFIEKNKIVVLGGPQASSVPLDAKKHAHAVVIGEGEKLWPIVLDDIVKGQLKDFYVCAPEPLPQLKGFNTYTSDGLPDLKNTPLPVRHLFKKKFRFNMVYAARGCPIDCSFCHVSKIFGKKMRLRDHESILEDISTLSRHFFLIDDSAFGRKNIFDYYINLYEKLQKLPKKRFWIAQGNLDAAANLQGQKVIEEAARAGLSYVSIGLESINTNDMKQTGVYAKLGVSSQENPLLAIRQNIEFIQRQGVGISAWFTIGLEHDTMESCKETLDFCMKANVFPVFNPIQALEGTRYYETVKANDMLTDQKTNVSNVKNTSMSNMQFIEVMQDVLSKAYNTKTIIARTLFYFKLIKKCNRGLFDLIHRTILIYATQRKIKKVLKHEIIRFSNRIS